MDKEVEKIVQDVLDSETGRELTYYTKDVAEMLNITQQMVRNYCNTYPEIFKTIPITSSGRRIFNANSIELLKRVINLTRNYNYTKEEIINAVKSTDTALLYEDEQKSLVKEIFDKWHDFFIKNEESSRQLLLINNENEKKIINLSEEVSGLVETNTELLYKVNEISSTNDNLVKTNNELKQQIEELKSLLLENKEAVIEIKESRKKGLFGFLRK